MKKITLKSLFAFILFTSLNIFGQGTGYENNSSDVVPQGIQNGSAYTSRSMDIPNVLIVAAPGVAAWITDVELKLEETGSINANTFLCSSGTPTLTDLQNYDAVFLFTDAGAADPLALGDVLEQYINSGNPVVDASFTPNVPVTGGFTQYELYSNSGQSNGTNLGFGSILEPNNPILTDVTSFDGGTASFYNLGGTIASGANVIVEYPDGTPLIISAENVGPANTRRVFLNFYPVSIDGRDDFWNTTSDGALIMRNALSWAIDGVVLSDGNNQFVSEISLYPNPAENELTINNPSGIFIKKADIIDITGRIVSTIDASVDIIRTIDVSNLSAGVFFLRIENADASRLIKFIKK